ncbi:hypothetical protein BAUCODRAFT_332979 [Baudoinia panamericana UAMH 10762]|uniref:Uncharacterized protein n=1 Tax=Baudoinia panamericana (strain UAMH 10762) TaxID=717646 RepID=M2M3B0_BAUPA|nr:uncharacterized protein BAUCODRAFT_332979 [Baudoinia panamericana UAMH 10762]EMC90996.1 hypothetical protein BAUCODRAFT_332979 [Baudoinia panamericana UAMH 10762]
MRPEYSTEAVARVRRSGSRGFLLTPSASVVVVEFICIGRGLRSPTQKVIVMRKRARVSAEGVHCTVNLACRCQWRGTHWRITTNSKWGPKCHRYTVYQYCLGATTGIEL